MKWLLLIIVFFITVVFKAQQQKTIALFIHNKPYKTYQVPDSVLLTNWMLELEFNKLLLIDSIVSIRNQWLIYATLSTNFFKLTISDTSVFKKVYSQKLSSSKEIKGYLSKVLRNYEDVGYPFASIELDTFDLKDNRWNVKYVLQPRIKISYDSLDLIGISLVSKNFLYSYLNIRPLQLYQEKSVKNVDRLLSQIPFYKVIRPTEVFFINNRARLRLFLDKNNANQFIGILGIGSDPYGKLFVNGDVQISLYNMLRIADMWQLQWKKNDILSQNLFFQGTIPYLFAYPVGLTALLSLHKQDTSYINLRYKAGLNLYTSGFNGFLIYYEKRQTMAYHNLTNDIAPVSTNYAGIMFKYHYTDKQVLPSNGYYVVASIAYGKKTLGKEADSLLLNKVNSSKPILSTFEGSIIFPLRRWLLFKFNTDAGWQQPVHFRNELFRLGGSHSIRGFDEESIYARIYAIASIESRFVADKNTQMFLFFDKMAYQSFTKVIDYPWSVGVGTEVNSRAGLFFVSYALGSQLGQSLNFRTAKIHFGYRNRF